MRYGRFVAAPCTVAVLKPCAGSVIVVDQGVAHRTDVRMFVIVFPRQGFTFTAIAAPVASFAKMVLASVFGTEDADVA